MFHGVFSTLLVRVPSVRLLTYHVAYASTTRGRSHSVNIISNSSPVTMGAALTSSVMNSPELVFVIGETLAHIWDVINACVDTNHKAAGTTTTVAIDFMMQVVSDIPMYISEIDRFSAAAI